MKTLLALITLMSVSVAHASYYATHCSNASATIKWETGHNSNSITFVKYSDEAKDVKIPLHKVKIVHSDEVVVHEESIHRCGYAARTKVTASKITITAADTSPEALDFLGEQKSIKTQVICSSHMNSRAACPSESIEFIEE